MPTEPPPAYLYHPRHFAAWLGVFTLFCVSRLSLARKQVLGAWLGGVIYRNHKSRARVTKINIATCMPELSDSEHNAIAKASFIATAQGFLESTHSWWRDVEPLIARLEVNGKQHLLEAQASGRGTLLIGGHFNVLDLALPLIASQLLKPGYMYRANKNPVIDRMIECGRRRHYNISAYNKRRLKPMIEFIRQGGEVWYAADQDMGRKCDMFVPFFGVSTACISTPSWIARESGANVIFVSQFRHTDGHYEIVFEPLSERFGEDAEADAIEWNRALEAGIRKHPAQYLWQHKRFKTRPPGEAGFY